MNRAAEARLDTETRASMLLENLRTRGWLSKKPRKQDLSRCLGVLLDALGWQGSVRQLSDSLPYNRSSLDAIDCMNLLAILGYKGHLRAIRFTALDKSRLPALFIPSDDNKDIPYPIVVLEHTAAGWLVFDAGKRTRYILEKANARGQVLWFEAVEPSQDNIDSSARTRAGYSWFQGVLSRFRPVIVEVFWISLLLNFFSLAVPIFVMVIYDKVIATRSVDTLPLLTLGVALALGTELALRLLRIRAVTWFGARLNALVGGALVERLLMLPPALTEYSNLASQLSRIRAFESARELFTGPIFLALLEIPFLFVLVITIGLIAGELVWVPIGIILLFILLTMLNRRRIALFSHRAARSQTEKQQAALELFSTLPGLEASGCRAALVERFQQHSARASHHSASMHMWVQVIEQGSYACTLLAGVLMLVLGVHHVWGGTMTAGALVATMILTWRVLNPLQTLCGSIPRLMQAGASIDQVNRLMALSPEHVPTHGTLKEGELKGAVQFHQVGLRYQRQADPVFANLNFTARPGEIIGVTGINGVGKSSVIKLVLGIYRQQAGIIRLDGIDTRQMHPTYLRRSIAYTPQVPEIFTGTLADNLRMTAPDASDEALQEALMRADAWEDISALPKGINTPIGHNGYRVGSGLAYRIQLARTYLTGSKLMLFDEMPQAVASSMTGSNFLHYLDEMRGKATVFFVSHRNDFLRHADQIIHLHPDQPPKIHILSKAANAPRVV